MPNGRAAWRSARKSVGSSKNIMAERGIGIRDGGRMEVLGGGDVWMEG